MKSDSSLNVTAVCPFYREGDASKHESSQCISCEGIYGVRNRTTFKRAADKDAHAEQFCTSIEGCKKCEIYKTIEKKKYKK